MRYDGTSFDCCTTQLVEVGSACVFALNNNSTSITFLHCQTFERRKKERNKMADGKCFKLPFSPTSSTNELWERELKRHMW